MTEKGAILLVLKRCPRQLLFRARGLTPGVELLGALLQRHPVAELGEVIHQHAHDRWRARIPVQSARVVAINAHRAAVEPLHEGIEQVNRVVEDVMVGLHIVDQETHGLHQLDGVALREHVPVLDDVVDQGLQRAELGEDHWYFLMDAGVVACDLVIDDGMGHAMPSRISVSSAPSAT